MFFVEAASCLGDRGWKPLPQGRTSLTEWGGAARHNLLFYKVLNPENPVNPV
jgi:hypothetical protein